MYRLLLVMALAVGTSGCQQVQLRGFSADERVAVGSLAEVRQDSTIFRCERSLSCGQTSGSIVSVELDPPGIFELVEDPSFSSRRDLLASRTGIVDVRLRGTIDGQQESGTVRITSVEVARTRLVAGAVPVTGIALEPGATARLDRVLEDAQGASLSGRGLAGVREPGGEVEIAHTGDGGLTFVAPNRVDTWVIEDGQGREVGQPRTSPGSVPSGLEVIMERTAGVAAPLTCIGRSGTDAVFGAFTVELRSTTPGVCEPEVPTAALGTTTSVLIRGAGTCEIEAELTLPGGGSIRTIARAPVAPAIRRRAR